LPQYTAVPVVPNAANEFANRSFTKEKNLFTKKNNFFIIKGSHLARKNSCCRLQRSCPIREGSYCRLKDIFFTKKVNGRRMKGHLLLNRGSFFLAKGSFFLAKGSFFFAKGSFFFAKGSFFFAKGSFSTLKGVYFYEGGNSMPSTAFNIAVKTLTTIAEDVLNTSALHPLLQKEGAKLEDWQHLQKAGQEAEAFDKEQQDIARKLTTVQAVLEATRTKIEKGIRDIKIRKKSILLDLKQDPTATADDHIFVKQLSIAMVAAPKNTAETTEQRKRNSLAQEALKVQMNRMVDGIEQHDAVAKAFASRELSHETLAELKQATVDLPLHQKARDAVYDLWLTAGVNERQAVATQNARWDSIRTGVARVAKTNSSVKQLLDRLAEARRQAKTGSPHKKKS
jgi:hypothetical protein